MSRQTDFVCMYFDWLYDKVLPDDPSYKEVCSIFNSISFVPHFGMDQNRAEDGESLRYRFADENGYPQYEVAEYLDDHPCSIFEMMVALCLRIDEGPMFDPNGSRTDIWFKEMIRSLGIGYLTNGSKYMHDDATFKASLFNDRYYEPNGRGSLFTTHNPSIDMRDYDIWAQMNIYLNELEENYE